MSPETLLAELNEAAEKVMAPRQQEAAGDYGCMCRSFLCRWCWLCILYGDPMPVPPAEGVSR